MFNFIVLAGLLLALALVCGSAHAARPHDTPGPPGTTLPHPAHMGDYYDEYLRPPAPFPNPHLKTLADAAYQRGHHAHALHMYRRASRWGDKFSQLAVGLMTWRGEGTASDRPLAWAWLALAAERGYPQIVEVRDEAWEAIDETGRGRAAELFAGLAEEFSDQAVQPRAQRQLDAARRTERMNSLDPRALVTLADGRLRLPIEMLNPKRYEFWNVVQYETDAVLGQPAGRVELRELRLVDD